MAQTAKVVGIRFPTGARMDLQGLDGGVGAVRVGRMRVTLPPRLVGLGVRIVPEGLFLRTAADQLAGPDLKGLFATAYRGIGRAREFKGVSSALPFCLSGGTKDSGHAFVYRPEAVRPGMPTVVCLHGYGGNFLFYPWSLMTELRDCLLVFPSWGVTYRNDPGEVEAVYDAMHDCLSHIRDHLEITPTMPPWLLAVSAGGQIGRALVSRHPSSYAGYISLSTSLNDIRVPAGYRVLSLHGSEDPGFPCEAEVARCQALRGQGVRAECKVWKGASHWLLISHRHEIGQAIRTFAGFDARRTS